MADETEEELLRYLQNHHPGAVWDTTERIMVAVTGAAGERRRASAGPPGWPGGPRATCSPSTCASVDGSSHADRLASVKQLVDDVGGHWYDVTGDDPARTVVTFAVDHHITQIVVGATRRSRWEEWHRGSVVRKVLRFAAETGIDVHVIARRDVPDRGPRTGSSRVARRRGGLMASTSTRRPVDELVDGAAGRLRRRGRVDDRDVPRRPVRPGLAWVHFPEGWAARD